MKSKFQKNSIMLLSIFFILTISVILFSIMGCVISAERGPYYGQGPAERRGDLGTLQGQWFINASNYTGKLEFHWERGMWVGRVWFDALQQWEPVTDIFFNPHTGELQFTRAVYSQRYTGTLLGNQISGTYTAPTGGTGPWAATREADRSGSVDLRGIQGQWFINASNYTGKLEFHWERGRWVGRVWFDALQQWEPVTDIFFNFHTGELQFTRVVYSQRYTGTLLGNQISGTYTAPAGGTGSWAASRP